MYVSSKYSKQITKKDISPSLILLLNITSGEKYVSYDSSVFKSVYTSFFATLPKCFPNFQLSNLITIVIFSTCFLKFKLCYLNNIGVIGMGLLLFPLPQERKDNVKNNNVRNFIFPSSLLQFMVIRHLLIIQRQHTYVILPTRKSNAQAHYWHRQIKTNALRLQINFLWFPSLFVTRYY